MAYQKLAQTCRDLEGAKGDTGKNPARRLEAENTGAAEQRNSRVRSIMAQLLHGKEYKMEDIACRHVSADAAGHSTTTFPTASAASVSSMKKAVSLSS